jgi:hypothetical protein
MALNFANALQSAEEVMFWLMAAHGHDGGDPFILIVMQDDR